MSISRALNLESMMNDNALVIKVRDENDSTVIKAKESYKEFLSMSEDYGYTVTKADSSNDFSTVTIRP